MRRDLPPTIAGPYWTGPSAREKLAYCRECLENAGGLQGVETDTTIAPPLTMEELVGAVLHANDELRELEEERDRLRARVDEHGTRGRAPAE